MAGQNTFKILLLNDANMIGEHQETGMKMPNMCLFEKRHFFTWIYTNDLEETETHFLKDFTNGTFKALQMKVFGLKVPCKESKVPNW